MKSWKKRWLAELDEKVQDMRDDVKNTPICVQTPAENEQRTPSRVSAWQRISAWIAEHKKAFYTAVATCSAAVVTAIAVLPALFASSPETLTAVAVQINPCAVFSVDGKGNVAAVVAGNADGDIILSDGGRVEMMTGKPVSQAAEIFVEYAEDFGFIDYQTAHTITVSGCENADVANGIKSALSAFFDEKQALITVQSETLAFDAFCQLTGVVAESLQTIGETLKNSPVLSAVRELAGMTLEQLQAAYKAVVSYDDLPEFIRGELQINFEKVRKHYEDIKAIYDLNADIVICERPLTALMYAFKNYWELKESGDYTAYGEELNGLLAQMDGLLAAYKNAYGVELLSFEQMNAVLNEYGLLPVEQIAEWLLNVFTDTFLSLQLNKLVDIFENVTDVSWMSEIYELPATQAEYAQKLSVYYNRKYPAVS